MGIARMLAAGGPFFRCLKIVPVITKKGLLSSHDVSALLACKRLPGRLTTSESAVLLGFQEHDIPVLASVGLLRPLGSPAANSPKYFAAVDVESCAQDRQWLDRATKALAKHWKAKNGRKASARIQLIREAGEAA